MQITDRPSAIKRVEHYLASVDKNVHRQVEIEAKLYDVTLSDQFQFSIDWVHVAKAYGGADSGRFVNGILDRIRKDLDRPAREPLIKRDS